jgi:hypothetical protein
LTSNDARSYTTADSHAMTDSGNTTINWTGTDGGALQLAQLHGQLTALQEQHNADAFAGLLGTGASMFDQLNRMATVSQANSMAMSTHMLDLTGELIDKVATGTQSMFANSSAAAQAATAATVSQTSQASATSKQLMLIGLAVVGLALLLRH